MDDLLVATVTWDGRIQTLSILLSRLRKTGITAYPSKCPFGSRGLLYLVHKVGHQDKVDQLIHAPASPTKKMRSDR